MFFVVSTAQKYEKRKYFCYGFLLKNANDDDNAAVDVGVVWVVKMCMCVRA
jgi:hypothetical protein